MNRRQTLKLLAGAAAFAGTPALIARGAFAQSGAQANAFTLPPLGYAYEALEPHIDTATMNFHHRNHHAAFIGQLNGLAARFPDLAARSPEEVVSNLAAIPEAIRTPVRNNMGGHWNHTFFWDLMTPGGPKIPAGDLKNAIDATFGGFEQMQAAFKQQALGRFGSGWAWLALKDGRLTVFNTPYQDSPHMDPHGARPIVGVDLWEHAYYLNYQYRRGAYVDAWWNVVNWGKAADNFKRAAA
jgi:Fe-Mn family superoxide dismutase